MKKLMVWGLSLNFLGTIALGIGLLPTNMQVADLSGTYFDANPHVAASLIANRNWAIVGFILVAVGFLLQLIATIKMK